MAKSTRSKVKRSYRAKKREDGVYAAIEAARLARLSSKLQAIRDADKDGDVEITDEETREGDTLNTIDPEGRPAVDPSHSDPMELDGSTQHKSAQKISTHGPRTSRRTEWRLSKGLPARPKPRGMNRQGSIAAKSRAGRAHRRR